MVRRRCIDLFRMFIVSTLSLSYVISPGLVKWHQEIPENFHAKMDNGIRFNILQNQSETC